MTRIGVDMGGTKCAGLLLHDDGQIIAATSEPTPVGGGAVIDTIVGVIEKLCINVEQNERPSAIGVGVPGLVTSSGSMRYAPHLFGVVEVDLRSVLEGRVGQPIEVMNDNTAAAWSEHRLGAGRGFDNMIYVGLGTGIGGAMIVNGKLVGGESGFAGELGHITIDRNGEICVCGRRGCWELYASGSGLARLAGRAGETVTLAGRSGDKRALDILRRFAADVAIGLADLINIFDPGCLVIGGGVLDPAEPLRELIAEALDTCLGDSANHRKLPELRAAGLGKHAGAIGAALLAVSAS
jgi:glucokinase